MKILLMVAALWCAAFASGCGVGPCDRLADLCKKCPDSSTRSSCESTVRSARSVPTGDATCQAVLDAKTYGSCE